MDRVLEGDPSKLVMVTAMMEDDGLLTCSYVEEDSSVFAWKLTETGVEFAERHGIDLGGGVRTLLNVGLVYAEGELEKVTRRRLG